MNSEMLQLFGLGKDGRIYEVRDYGKGTYFLMEKITDTSAKPIVYFEKEKDFITKLSHKLVCKVVSGKVAFELGNE